MLYLSQKENKESSNTACIPEGWSKSHIPLFLFKKDRKNTIARDSMQAFPTIASRRMLRKKTFLLTLFSECLSSEAIQILRESPKPTLCPCRLSRFLKNEMTLPGRQSSSSVFTQSHRRSTSFSLVLIIIIQYRHHSLACSFWGFKRELCSRTEHDQELNER